MMSALAVVLAIAYADGKVREWAMLSWEVCQQAIEGARVPLDSTVSDHAGDDQDDIPGMVMFCATIPDDRHPWPFETQHHEREEIDD